MGKDIVGVPVASATSADSNAYSLSGIMMLQIAPCSGLAILRLLLTFRVLLLFSRRETRHERLLSSKKTVNSRDTRLETYLYSPPQIMHQMAYATRRMGARRGM